MYLQYHWILFACIHLSAHFASSAWNIFLPSEPQFILHDIPLINFEYPYLFILFWKQALGLWIKDQDYYYLQQ